MSDTAKKARVAMKEKAQRLASPTKGDIDASGWSEPTMNTGAKTGLRPISPRAFKRGGKIVKAEGGCAVHHAGRKPRKSGGRTLAHDMALAKMNRNLKEANEERGTPHVGGYKHGGKPHRRHHAEGGKAAAENTNKMTSKNYRSRLEESDPTTTDIKTPAGAANAMTSQEYRDRLEAAQPRRRGGRAHKLNGGPMSMDPRAGAAALMQAGAQQANVPTSMMTFGTPPKGKFARMMGMKKGGKIGHMEWEHSKKDLREDKKLAKKHGMSLEAWEKSKLDEKHDKQQSMKGLKSGGSAGKWISGAIKHPGALHKALHVPAGEKIPAKKLEKAAHSDNPKMARRANLAKTLKSFHHAKGGKAEDNYEGGTRPTGGRMARKSGGRAKGKTNVNIIIGAGRDGQQQMQPGMMGARPPMMPPPGGPPGVPVPVGNPQAAPAAMPMPMPVPMPMGSGAGGPPMPRKSGGRAYPKMRFGAGSGEGRLEKIEEYGLTPPK